MSKPALKQAPKTLNRTSAYENNTKVNHLEKANAAVRAQDHINGQPDPLLLAVKQSLASPGEITIQQTGQDVTLSFNGIALGAYRVQWTDNLAGGSWNTLAVTNVSGPAQPLQVVDTNVFSQPQRFYRVQSPP